jgi:hypothetical protein
VLEREKLEAKGADKELIQNLTTELNEFKAKEVQNMRAQVSSQVRQRGAELGCLNTKLMMAEINVDSFEVDPTTLEIVNRDQLNSAIEAFKKENPFMFKQAGPQLKDGVPGSKPVVGQAKDLSKMTTAEIIEQARAEEMAKRS